MAAKTAKEPKLLSGGNPQIPKGDGNAPVRDYIAAMPGWKKRVGKTLDEIVTRTLPQVQKAVKWNSPFYGVENPVWFMNFHCFDRYVKVTFFDGAALDPPPPETSKYPKIRYFHVHEDDVIDEKLFAKWVKQASKLPGEKM
jgi:hypothetical protein